MTRKAKIVMFMTCVIAVAYILIWLGLRGMRSRADAFEGTATFVDDIVSDQIPVQDILRVTFIKRNPGVDSTDEVYTVTSRTEVAEMMGELASRLKKDVFRGHTYRNHPASLPPRVDIRVFMRDGSKYQSYIMIGSNWDGESYYYAGLNTWPRIRAGANLTEASRYWLHDHSIKYESRELVAFMEEFSPFLPDELELRRKRRHGAGSSRKRQLKPAKSRE